MNSSATSRMPLRHGMDMAVSRRMAEPISRFFIADKASAEPDPARWQQLGEGLSEGDPLADALVDWMFEHGMGSARALFEQALNRGLASVQSAPGPLRDFFEHVERAPEWLDRARLEKGVQASYLSGLTGLRVLRDFGLMAGYQAGAINQTLVMTGVLEKGAARRIAETTKWRMDCSVEHGMDRFNDGFKNTVRVRMIHAIVRRHVGAHPQWDAQRWGLPINQVDMQATYLGFSALYVLGQRAMGTLLTAQEAEDIMHLWRYVGWLMGVDDKWLCDSLQAGFVSIYQNLLSQAPPDESSQQLGRALMDEPLMRHYPRWRWLRGQWDKQVHLSICSLCVGRQGLRALGLPRWAVPWYPVLFAPLNFTWCALNRALPGGRERLIAQGRRAQLAQLAIMFGTDDPAIVAMGRVQTPS